MKSHGNCGDGERGELHEPRECLPHQTAQHFGEVAWHNGKRASATGYDAVKRHVGRLPDGDGS